MMKGEDPDQTARTSRKRLAWNRRSTTPHKFRATCCTKLLQSGIDLKTVQKLMGHKTIESTMRYLAKAESKKVRAKVDAVQWKKTPPAKVKAGAHSLPLETKLVWSEE